MNWNEYFMSLAYLTAMKSKDDRTKIGAIIVGPDKEIRSTGFNGLPRGVNDKRCATSRVFDFHNGDYDEHDEKETQKLLKRHERPEKYFYYEHAERNAIYNAARTGIPLLGTTMYTQGTPCADCGRAIIQAGIETVYVDEDWEKMNAEKWAESAKRTQIMFNEAGVSLVIFKFENLISKIEGLHDGKIIGLGDE